MQVFSKVGQKLDNAVGKTGRAARKAGSAVKSHTASPVTARVKEHREALKAIRQDREHREARVEASKAS